MGIFDKLSNIQQKIKATKNLYNSFGKYSYRSAESILEALKPLLAEHECTLILRDDIVNLGERYYIKATAVLIDLEDGSQVESTAYARESLTKKGMDDSQITGTASSYSRKYCLSGLFLLDDNKDADTNEYHSQTSERSRTALIKTVKSAGKKAGINVDGWLQSCNRDWDTVTDAELTQMLNTIRDREVA